MLPQTKEDHKNYRQELMPGGRNPSGEDSNSVYKAKHGWGQKQMRYPGTCILKAKKLTKENKQASKLKKRKEK